MSIEEAYSLLGKQVKYTDPYGKVSLGTLVSVSDNRDTIMHDVVCTIRLNKVPEGLDVFTIMSFLSDIEAIDDTSQS